MLVLPVRPGAGGPGGAELAPGSWAPPADVRSEATALLPAVRHSGGPGETYVGVRPGNPVGRLVLLGVGGGTEADWRTAGAALARSGALDGTVALVLPGDAGVAEARGMAEGLWLASYRFRVPPQNGGGRPDGADAAAGRGTTGVPAGPGTTGGADAAGGHDATGGADAAGGDDPGGTGEPAVWLVVSDPVGVQEALTAARITAETTRLARDLTNMPSSVKSPEWLADQIVAAAAGHPGLEARVREPDWLSAEGFGGVLAVGGGSVNPPRLVELSWRPEGATTHVVLVGKGITFDTGGLSIKPRDAMKLMRKDMGGAAAILAATVGAAALRLPVRITALAPLAENMVSGSAFRPGDVIRHYGGLTSESTNSDAEGRLVLADALSYARERLAPDVLVDLATLTGANAVALGSRTAALYSDNDELATAVLDAAAAAGERAWRMPLPDDYLEYLHSDLADLHSSPAAGAGSVTAALYLREFAGELRDRWLHLDMSAPSWAAADSAELTKGATGWGVRTLLRWLAGL
ncbi:leucyl aminopeptidase family protein [Plantactinospora siamensis]|uniref:leucyl aminopeptidase family protein n=1 Tax=Plantactinospora siamensis TaxID=555372 RepID=UPI00406BD2D3